MMSSAPQFGTDFNFGHEYFSNGQVDIQDFMASEGEGSSYNFLPPVYIPPSESENCSAYPTIGLRTVLY